MVDFMEVVEVEMPYLVEHIEQDSLDHHENEELGENGRIGGDCGRHHIVRQEETLYKGASKSN